MTPARAIGLAVAGGAVAAGAFMYTQSGGSSGSTADTYDVTVEATPRDIDEGDLVEFIATATERAAAASGQGGFSFPEFAWDFGDGSAQMREVDLTNVSHRFENGGSVLSMHRVRVRVEGSEGSTTVRVRNVPPTIRAVGSSKPALAGSPVSFEASATDPGLQDRLTYAWDFGDGATSTGERVSHTFRRQGIYDVSLVVTDGDGGEDRETLSVIVGDGFRFTVGGAGTGTQQGWIWVRNRQPASLPATNLCHVEIRFEPGGEGLARLTAMPLMGLSIAADGGLRVGKYGVTGAHWTDPAPVMAFEHRAQFPDLFFGGVSSALTDPLQGVGPYPSGAHFTALDGMVSIDYLDTKRIEGHFWMGPMWGLVNRTPFGGEAFEIRTATVTGQFAGTLAPPPEQRVRVSAPWQVYDCKGQPPEAFDLVSLTPGANSRNVEPQNPTLAMAFNRAVDPATIARSVRLEYGRPWGTGELPPTAYHPVPGTWEVVPGDDHSIQFVPQAHLLDGVIYCVRVRTGRDGLRGRRGEVLNAGEVSWSERNRPACDGGRPWKAAHEWAFATLVELNAVRLNVYQASIARHDIALVPGKPAVARVYADWVPKESRAESGVNRWSQVERFPARVSVRQGPASGRDVVAPRRVEVTRPDLFNQEDRRQARHTVNIFGWTPTERSGTAQLRAFVEPVDGMNQPVPGRRFESASQPIPHWNQSPILSFDYYFLRMDGCLVPGDPCEDWSESVPTAARGIGQHLSISGATFATQNFPVIGTQGRSVGDLWVEEPLQFRDVGRCDPALGESKAYLCYHPGSSRPGVRQRAVHRVLGEQLYEAGRDSYADVLVGLLPDGVATHWAGMMTSWNVAGKRVVLADVRALHAGGLVHEFGHFFNLDHCPSPSDPNCLIRVIGFRMNSSGASGFNKLDIEGNAEADRLQPLMHYQQRGVPEVFLAAGDYQRLFETIPATPRRQQAHVLPRAAPGRLLEGLATLLFPRPVFAQAGQAPAREGRLLVSGTVFNGEPTLHRVQFRPEAAVPPLAPAVAPSGDLTLELLDAGGQVLASRPFDAAGPDPWHGEPAGGPAAFTLDVPAPAGLHTVRVRAPGGASAEQSRSAGAPTLEASVSDAGAGARTLQWSAADPDGDAVQVDVYLRADGEGPWRGVATGTTKTTLRFGAEQLLPGGRLAARLVASDGFNTTATEVDLGPGAPLAVLAVTPNRDARDVSPVTDVVVQLSAPLATAGRTAALETDRIRLVDADGTAVFSDVEYRPTTRTIVLAPVGPLRPGTRYTVTLAAGLEDPWGGRLAEAVSWSFTTAAVAVTEAQAGPGPPQENR